MSDLDKMSYEDLAARQKAVADVRWTMMKKIEEMELEVGGYTAILQDILFEFKIRDRMSKQPCKCCERGDV